MSEPRELFDAEHRAFREGVVSLLRAESSGRVSAGLREAGGSGFLGIRVPESAGGGGSDDPRFAAVFGAEAAASGSTALAVSYGLHAAVALPLLAAHGGVTVDRLAALCKGELSITVAGLDAGARVSVEVDGDELIVSGEAADVPGAAVADLALVVASSADGPRLFVVDLETVNRTPVRDALGPPDAEGADLTFDGVRVAAGAQLAEPILASASARTEYNLYFAAVAVAVGRAALDHTHDYVAQRRVFGRTVAEFENTRIVLANVRTDLAAAQALADQALADHTAARLEQGASARAALTAVEAATRAADAGLQLHGGYGYMREYPIAQAFADARYLLLRAPAAGLAGPVSAP